MSQTTHPQILKSFRYLQASLWFRRVGHWLVRATWMALLVPTIFMIGYLWADWEVKWYYWVIPMLVVGSVTVLWSMRPISLKRITHRLDDRLELQTRLTTAFEVSHKPEAENPVVQSLLQETDEITNTVRRGVRFVDRSLWVEMQALIAVAAILGALLMLDILAPHVPPQIPPVDLPATWQEPRAEEVMPGPQLAESISPENVDTDPLKEEDFQKALQILADALRDQAATHSIAEAIDQGDLDRAAEGLRRLADQLDSLSPEARTQLGDSLQEAADKIGDIARSFTEPLQAGSTALDNDDLLQAGQALEDLAKVIEQIETDPAEVAEYKPLEQDSIPPPDPVELEQNPEAPQQENTQNTVENELEENEQPPEEERLGVEGEPLELESDPEQEEDKVVESADPDAEASDEETESTPFTRQPLITPSQELGPDPLIYPWQKREVVRRYFTP